MVVIPSDKDLAQLVSDQVTLYDFGKGERFTPDGVRRKFGVRPERVGGHGHTRQGLIPTSSIRYGERAST